MAAHNLKHSEMHISPSIWDVWGCLPSALPTTHILSVFLLRPIAKLKSQLCVSPMELSLSPPSLEQWFLFSKAHSEMALFSDSHSVAPSARACQEVRLPELEPGPVYTNSSEKYGCIIIEAVSFNVASSLWKPLHAWSATMSGGWWNSDQRWRERFFAESIFFLWVGGVGWGVGTRQKKELLDGIEWAPSKANKHESQGGDRDCCGCPTHKYRV